jgi:predicted transglutaminase-like cysteine proteinase
MKSNKNYGMYPTNHADDQSSGGSTTNISGQYNSVITINVDMSKVEKIEMTERTYYKSTVEGGKILLYEATPAPAKKSLEGAVISGYESSYKACNKRIMPEVTVTIDGQVVSPSDYEVTYGDNKDANTDGWITVTAKEGSNYEGSKTVTFSIYNGKGHKWDDDDPDSTDTTTKATTSTSANVTTSSAGQTTTTSAGQTTTTPAGTTTTSAGTTTTSAGQTTTTSGGGSGSGAYVKYQKLGDIDRNTAVNDVDTTMFRRVMLKWVGLKDAQNETINPNSMAGRYEADINNDNKFGDASDYLIMRRVSLKWSGYSYEDLKSRYTGTAGNQDPAHPNQIDAEGYVLIWNPTA